MLFVKELTKKDNKEQRIKDFRVGLNLLIFSV